MTTAATTQLEALLRASCEASGVPVLVEDQDTLLAVAALLRA
jgi:hypothetical protein